MNQATYRAWARHLRPRRTSVGDSWLEVTEQAWRWAHAETWCRAAHAMIREGLAHAALVDEAIPILSAVGLSPGEGSFGLYTSPTANTLLDTETPPALGALARQLIAPDPTRAEAPSQALAELRSSRFYLAMNRLFWHRRAARGTHGPDEAAALDGEQWVLEGHPWHPMTRTRVGLSVAESLRHAPELCGVGLVRVLEVPADWAQATAGWNEAQRAWLGAPSPGHIRVPMHAAQLRRWTRMIGGLPESCRLVRVHHDGRSLLSLRTLQLEEHDLHVKLALDVLTTSATRTVSPMSTFNGPRISKALEGPFARDPCLRPLRLIPDHQAISMSVPGFEPLSRHSGAIVRARPGSDGKRLIVAAALGSTPPGGAVTVLRSLLSRGDPPASGDPMRLISALSDRLLRPAAHVLVRYGVALETHLQNLLLEFSGADLQAVHVRDLGGIRILRGVRVPVEIPTLHPDSFIETTDFDELIDKFIHTTLHATFHSVVEWSCREAKLDRDEVWRIAARGLRASLTPLLRHDDAQTRARAESAERRIFAPRVRAKALMTMRLTGRFSTYDTIWVDNPLAGLHEDPDDAVVGDALP